MKRIHIILLIVFSAIFSFSQSDSLTLEKRAKDRYGIWFIPTASKNIYGIAIGPLGSEVICNRPYTKFSYGLNLQLFGEGFLQVMYINKLKHTVFNESYYPDSINMQDTIPLRAVHNGILISPLGTFTDLVDGISLSAWMSMGKKINGLSFNLIWNLYEQVNGVSIGIVNQTVVINGVQIGLVNKTKKIRGFQFGLWNINEKRSLPIINWNFTIKKSVEHNRLAPAAR